MSLRLGVYLKFTSKEEGRGEEGKESEGGEEGKEKKERRWKGEEDKGERGEKEINQFDSSLHKVNS